MTRTIIGFTGLAGSGKSSACGMIQGAQQRDFATPLKAMAERVFPGGFTRAQLYGASQHREEIAACGYSARRVLQLLGTEFGRGLDPDFWIKQWAASLPSSGVVVVGDVRFPNEVAKIQELGGQVVRLLRYGHKSAAPAHASEASLDGVRLITVEAGTLAELREQLHAVLGSVVGDP